MNFEGSCSGWAWWARFLGAADYPGGTTSRMQLLEARAVGDVALLRYAPEERA